MHAWGINNYLGNTVVCVCVCVLDMGWSRRRLVSPLSLPHEKYDRSSVVLTKIKSSTGFLSNITNIVDISRDHKARGIHILYYEPAYKIMYILLCCMFFNYAWNSTS